MNEIARLMFSLKAANDVTQVKTGTGVIIRDSLGRILLEKRSDCGMWGLPGGRIEPGESILDAATREVKEETSLTVEIIRLVGVYSEPQDRILIYPDNGDVRHLIDIVLEARILSGELVCSSESEALCFFAPEELPTEIVPPALAPLQDVLQGLVGVVR
jgi:ADP-ribose pyrophosphatase YjhB (NUDIX family)